MSLLTSSGSLLPAAFTNIEEQKGKSFRQGDAKGLKGMRQHDYFKLAGSQMA